jgi:rod shape-determining protein MreC
MVRLNDDGLFLRRGGRAEPRRRVRPILLLLIFVSLALMILSRLHHSALTEMRWRVASAFAPLLQAATVPVEHVREIGRTISSQLDMTAELQRLKAENRKLSGWEWRAKQLEAKLADLEALAKVVAEQRLEFVTSRVIADSSGAFARSEMIDSGGNQNVKAGYPVINADGLVGRIVDVGPNSSRVLLASDLNSRIPVTVGPKAVRAILAGDNGPNPRLLYLPDGAKIAAGDDVATSGTGGLFPPGLRIGAVTGDLNQPRVSLRARLDRLDYVSVLFFDDPSRALAEDVAADASRGHTRKDESSKYAQPRRPAP